MRPATVGSTSSPPPVTVTLGYLNPLLVTRFYDPRDFPDWVPVPPGTQFIEITSNVAQNTFWSVTFGIDG